MPALNLILLLLAVSAGLRLIADRIGVPYPSVLVVGGALLALAPGLPPVDLPPDVLFLIFIPPLLYSGAVSYPLRDFRRELGPITRLAVLMVLVSTSAVAVAVHAWDSAFTWPAAFTLGAIVSPPDPVAVLSMLRGLRLPRTVTSVLEGEGLFNDVTALVAYRIAVAAAVTGRFAAWEAGRQFLFAGIAGIAIGLAIGVMINRAHRFARLVPVVENTISLLTPFASYLVAERFGASGVLAVVATGMYVTRTVPQFMRPESRVQSIAIWNVVTFILESLIFILVGLELPHVARVFDRHPFPELMREAAMVVVVAVAVRLLWIGPSAYVGRAIGRVLKRHPRPFQEWRQVVFIGWAGLRGGDSLVIALALPLATATGVAFPAREQILFITFAVIFVTLVLQGPTLRPFARLLGIRADGRDDVEEAHARLAVVEAGLYVLSSFAATTTSHPEVVRYLGQRHRQRARRWATREAAVAGTEVHRAAAHEHSVAAPSHAAGALDDSRALEYRRIRGEMLRGERAALLELRDSGAIGDDVMRRIQRDLDFESLLLETRDPVADPPTETPAAIEASTRRK